MISPASASESALTGPTRHVERLAVRYAETDQMGVVHHSNYLVWFEQARTGLCVARGFPYHEIEASGVWLMVTGAHLKYRGGARYGDEVDVAVWVSRYQSRGLHFAYEVKRDDELLVSGSTEHVWVETATKRTCRIPEHLVRPFRELAGLGDA